MSLKYHLQAALEREELYVRVVPVRPGGAGKPHIRGLQPVAATGHLYVLPTQLTLRQELDDYPLGKNDDQADALGLQLQLWRGVLSEERVAKYKAAEERILRITQAKSAIPEAAAMMIRDDRGHLPTADDVGWDPDDHRYGEIRAYEMDM